MCANTTYRFTSEFYDQSSAFTFTFIEVSSFSNLTMQDKLKSQCSSCYTVIQNVYKMPIYIQMK